MSHHLDTPLASQNGQLYLDDLYVFQGNASTVFVMDVNSNITGVHVKPGFHTEARYEFKVHFDGADFETLTYRVSFGEPDSGGQQHLQVHALTGAEARDDSATGQLVLEGRTGNRPARMASGSGQGASPTRSTSTYRYSRSSTVQSKMVQRWTFRHGARKTQRTVSLTRRSTRSSWESHMSIRSCGPVPASDLGRHENRHGRGRLAADQPRRASHDVADLLARRHPVYKSRQHKTSVKGL